MHNLIMSFSGFFEVGIAFLVEPEASQSERSIQDMVIRVISLSSEGLISNLVYALLGVSAMSRVNMRFLVRVACYNMKPILILSST